VNNIIDQGAEIAPENDLLQGMIALVETLQQEVEEFL
jgi:hypothetical protein